MCTENDVGIRFAPPADVLRVSVVVSRYELQGVVQSARWHPSDLAAEEINERRSWPAGVADEDVNLALVEGASVGFHIESLILPT